MNYHNIEEQLQAAMIAGDKMRLGVLRMLKTEAKNGAIAKKVPELSPDEILAVVRRLIKQAKDSLQESTTAGRSDLAAQTAAEITLLESFLPAEMSDADLAALVARVKAASGITDPKETGKLMGLIMKEVAGRADGARVKALVESNI